MTWLLAVVLTLAVFGLIVLCGVYPLVLGGLACGGAAVFICWALHDLLVNR